MSWSAGPLFGGRMSIWTNCCSALGRVDSACWGVIVGFAAAGAAIGAMTKSPSWSCSAWSIAKGSGLSSVPAALGSSWWTITPPGDAEDAVMEAAAIPSAVVLEALSDAAIVAEMKLEAVNLPSVECTLLLPVNLVWVLNARTPHPRWGRKCSSCGGG